MINRYEELLHKNWKLATKEQKARIDALRSKIEKDDDKPIQITFVKASDKRGV